MESLESKIENKSAKIAVCGLGYVGLPLALEFAKAGFYVYGIDIDKSKIQKLKNGESYIDDIESKDIKDLVNKFVPVDYYSIVKDVDVVIICVPTPLRKSKDPDISYIVDALNNLKNYLHKNMLIVLESTSYPGTTRDLIFTEAKKAGFKIGKEIFIAFSPERIDPGNKIFKIRNTPKIVGGITKRCSAITKQLYSFIIDSVICVSSPEVAEMVKLLENTFRMVNISLVNEIALACDRMKINVWEVIEAAKTKPFGFMSFFPGPGLGGHCIPIDPQFLSWKLKSLNFTSRFIEVADEINSRMPEFVVYKLSKILNSKNKPLKNSKILILGATYKANIADTRDSPFFEILQVLLDNKVNVYYNDPYIPSINFSGKIFHSKSIDKKLLNSMDCVLILVGHNKYDWRFIVKNSQLIFDTRYATSGIKSNKIFLL